MIPLRLKLSGFLSYHDPVELDFTGFDLACISGSNGAGKSSLLDAMTWALFGQARKRDDALINLPTAREKGGKGDVTFIFEYEKNIYKIIRVLPAPTTRTNEKTLKIEIVRPPSSLEFQLLEADKSNAQRSYSEIIKNGEWRPLTEHSLRETQARIEQVLRLDYDTFINVSFFLQGRADQFAQQPPTRRKEILGNILGLEIWEVYKERAADQRKKVESALDAVDGRVLEIDGELAEEEPRKSHLAEMEAQLRGLVSSRKVQETTLANVKQVRTAVDKQRELVRKLGEALERSQANMSVFQARLAGREAERLTHVDLIARAAEAEAAYAAWQQARLDLEKWDQVAGQFREHETKRQPLLEEIATEKARLEQEKASLDEQSSALANQSSEIGNLESDLITAREGLAGVEEKLAERLVLEKQSQEAREKLAELRAENIGLKAEMDELKERIETLEATDGAACPLCGQPLSPEHRQSTLEQLKAEGKSKGDRWRANKSALEELAVRITGYELRIRESASVEIERLAHTNTIAQLTERLEARGKQLKEWETSGAKRLAKVTKLLETEKFAAEARKQLAKVDKGLAALGYDAAAHDTVRRVEVGARSAEGGFRALESARAAIKPLDNEISSLNSLITDLAAEIAIQQVEHHSAENALAEVESQAPDLDSAERSLFDLQERENQLHQEVGAARQKVTVLDDLRKRKKKFEADRGGLGLQIGRYKTLERAFGKDGVPALLIEQALPEIEMKANEILGRLSDDTMRLHFETQARYKDEKRKDLRETLEIQVSDGAGLRDYEMFSVGEAFRVNFAIRLALSEVLARRKGARLQMLVIDEGFGSQDALGRQRLIQAINAVKGDFAKILVITHLEELKDAFPTRIEVEKTERGSTVVVI
jgi:exonuclease SbcC